MSTHSCQEATETRTSEGPQPGPQKQDLCIAYVCLQCLPEAGCPAVSVGAEPQPWPPNPRNVPTGASDWWKMSLWHMDDRSWGRSRSLAPFQPCTPNVVRAHGTALGNWLDSPFTCKYIVFPAAISLRTGPNHQLSFSRWL